MRQVGDRSECLYFIREEKKKGKEKTRGGKGAEGGEDEGMSE